MHVRTILALVATLAATAALAAESVKGDEIADRIQKMRCQSKPIADGGTRAELEKCVARLEEALGILAQEDVRELAAGNPYLRGRNFDVRVDLATVYARLGEKEKALDTLEAMQAYAWIAPTATRLAGMPEFQDMREDPRFRQFIARGKIASRMWKDPAIATPYKEQLSVEERVAGLSLFWAEARQHFVYFDHVPDLDWDEVYLQYLRRVMEVKSTEEYYRVMMQLAPLLGDAHTNIYAPRELRERFYSRPPLRTRRVGERVLVTEVPSPSLATRASIGDEVVAIDGVPVMAYAEERVRPFVSSSTPQDRDVRMFTYQLLSGDAETPVKLRLRTPDGSEREVEVARKGYTDVEPRKSFRFEMLSGDVAYLSVDHFESAAGVKAFEEALPRILPAKALVLDLRHNGGGSTQYGLQILSYLTDKPIPVSAARQRADVGVNRGELVKWQALPGSAEPVVLKRDRHFDGPVAVLIGPETFSAAEDFLVSFDSLHRGIMVGEPSGGSTGQPLFFQLPGGGTARICVKRDSYPDGREFVGKGIAPDIAGAATVEDFRAGRDVVLDRAVAALLKR